jgi:hypothetical protein
MEPVALGSRQPGPESSEPLPLPAHDRIWLNENQGVSPTAPNLRQTDPEQPIPLRQHRPFAFLLESGQLQPQRQVFDSDSLMPAAQQSNKAKQIQNDGQHAIRLLSRKIKLSRTDAFWAKDSR